MVVGRRCLRGLSWNTATTLQASACSPRRNEGMYSEIPPGAGIEVRSGRTAVPAASFGECPLHRLDAFGHAQQRRDLSRFNSNGILPLPPGGAHYGNQCGGKWQVQTTQSENLRET